MPDGKEIELKSPQSPPSPFEGFSKQLSLATYNVKQAQKKVEQVESSLSAHKMTKWSSKVTWFPFTFVQQLGKKGVAQEAVKSLIDPGEAAWKVKEQELLAEHREAVRELGRSLWVKDFYDSIPNLVDAGLVSSLEDYLSVMKSDPGGIISSAEMSAARETIAKLTAGKESLPRSDAPAWLTVPPEKEKAIREAFELKTKPPVTIRQLTVEALLKSLTGRRPTMQMPEGMTPEEMLQFASIMDIPEEEVNRTVELEEMLKPYTDAIVEREEKIKAVLLGEEEWRMPELSLWEKVKFALLSPMQVAADLIRPYIENVSYPVAGFAAYTVSRFLSGTQEIEEQYSQMKALGQSPWEAMKEAYQEWTLPWYYKLGLEIVTDPLTYTPGILLKAPGVALLKTGRAILAGGRVINPARSFVGVTLQKAGSGILKLNEGMWIAMDLPFDAFKTMWRAIPKTFNQATKHELNSFRDLLVAASSKQSGHIASQLTPDDLAKTLEKSVQSFRETPMKQGDVFVDLGAELSKHAPLDEKAIKIWSRSLGGDLEAVTPKILADVEDTISDAVLRMGSPAENAKRIAIALGVEDTPAVISKIVKDLAAITNKYSTRVARAIEIGKTSKINPVAKMSDFLVTGQKGIIQAIERSSYAKGKVFEGIVLAMMNTVDKLERGKFRMTLDRWLVRPAAEAYLGSVAYPIWNVFESMIVSTLEGVVPRQAKQEAFQRMFSGVVGVDHRVMQWSASDVQGILGTLPGRGGSISLLPGEVPEKVLGLKTPKWLAGKDYFEWIGRKWIELSDVWGTGYRANFLMRKMAQYLAEYSYDVSGHDINAAFRRLMRGTPNVSKETLGLTKHELEQEMFSRLSTGVKSEVQGMKELLSNSSLIQGEALKILRQADHISPQAKTLGEQMIASGEALGKGAAVETKAVPRLFWSYGGKTSLVPQILPEVGYVKGNIIDPFFGTGAVPLSLKESGNLGGKIIAYEANTEIRNLYSVARSSPQELLDRVFNLYKSDRTLGEDGFRAALERLNSEGGSPIERAADYLVVSRHAERNDIQLVKGKFLAYYSEGKAMVKDTARFRELLKQAVDSVADLDLRAPTRTSYLDAVADAKRGDAVYLDPPYMGIKVVYPGTSMAGDWTEASLDRLLAEAKRASDRGVRVVISLDKKAAGKLEEVGAKIKEVSTAHTGGVRRGELVATLGPEPEALIGMGRSAEETITGFCRTIADQSIADLKAFPSQAPDAFRFMADQIENTIEKEVRTPDDLMQMFQHYEVMTDSASRVPVRLLSQVMEESDELKRLGKFGQLEKLWRTSRGEVESVTDSINSDLVRAKNAIQSKSYLLTEEQQGALTALLERQTARIALQEQFLKFDGRLLDDFWQLPRAMRTAEAHTELRSYRLENFLRYKGEDAVLGAGDFLERKSYAQLYHKLPKPRLFHVDATNRALSADDCAKAMGCNVDALTTGMMESMTFQDKPYFIQMIKQSADQHPTYYKGFTEDKIGEVYDSILRGLRMSPEKDVMQQKILQQVEGIKQRMIALRMRKSLTPAEEKALHRWVDDIAGGMDEIFGGRKKGGIVTREAWDEVRQKASDSAHREYYKAFADYTNENIIDAAGKMIYPFWTYHLYRWFFLSRTFLRKPGTMAAWGKYYEYSDYGYQHIPGTDLEFNPAVGSAFGATFSLGRHDFKSYYENLGWLGEMLDFTQRRGFYPGIHVALPVALTSAFSGRPPELGEVLPPLHNVGINFFAASQIPGVAEAAKWLKDRVFHSNFHDYYTTTLVSSKQVEAGGKLAGGQSGVDLWFKMQRGESLTEEEQELWDEAYREAAWYGLLRSEFPEFRMRAEEMLEAYKQVTTLLEEQTGMTEEFQDDLWRHNLRPTDVMGGVPLDLQMALDQMWQWRIYFGRGAVLMPPEYSDLYNLINKYHDRVETFQLERLSSQGDIDEGFTNPTADLHFSGGEWRREYANNWSAYNTRVESLEKDPEFADAVDAMTPEGQVRLAQELGFTPPPTDPMREAIRLYFEVELQEVADPYTGEKEFDYLRFWLEREAIKMALPEEQRAEFDAYIRRYQTPMEVLFKRVTGDYLRGYRAISRIILEEFTESEKALIAEFYADTTTRDRKEEIKNVTSHSGRKLISYWDSRRTEVRQALRRASPKLDFWLYVFGYVSALQTTEAEEMVRVWENDRTSIVRGITDSPFLVAKKEAIDLRKIGIEEESTD